MVLGKHEKNKTGRFRRERKDTLLGTLAPEYPVLRKYNPRMQLGTLEKKLHVDSLDQALKKQKK